MTAASSADPSGDARSQSNVKQCSFLRDEEAGKESPLQPSEASLGGAKFSPAADVADVTAAFHSVSLLEASERAPLGGSGVQKKGDIM